MQVRWLVTVVAGVGVLAGAGAIVASYMAVIFGLAPAEGLGSGTVASIAEVRRDYCRRLSMTAFQAWARLFRL